MPHRRTTFSKFIIEDQRRRTAAEPDLTALLNDIQTGCKFIASMVSRGALDDSQRATAELANEIMLRESEWGGKLGGIVSALTGEPYPIPVAVPHGPYLLLFNALDGARNLDLNLPVGTIFSVLRLRGTDTRPDASDFLQAGREQVAAGFALYGAASLIVITLGAGVHGFTLDREIGAYTLTHPEMRIPGGSGEIAIDAANEPSWEPPVRHYIEERLAAKVPPGEPEVTMHWVDSLVAETYRLLVRGGVYLRPRSSQHANDPRARLLYEANPIAMVVEQAGGMASTGRAPVLALDPTSLHERVPLVLGVRSEVERIVEYHNVHDRGGDLAFETPLFRTRSLFRTV